MIEPAVLAAVERQGEARVSEEAPGNKTYKFCLRSMPEKSPLLGLSTIHGHIFIKYFFILFLYFTSFREPESRVQCGLRGGLYGQLVNIIWEINHVSVGFVSTSYGIRINKLWEEVKFSSQLSTCG